MIECNLTLKSKIKDLLKNKNLPDEERRSLNRELVLLDRSTTKCKRIAKCAEKFITYDKLYEGTVNFQIRICQNCHFHSAPMLTGVFTVNFTMNPVFGL